MEPIRWAPSCSSAPRPLSANPVDRSDIRGTRDFDGVEGPSTKAERDWKPMCPQCALAA